MARHNQFLPLRGDTPKHLYLRSVNGLGVKMIASIGVWLGLHFRISKFKRDCFIESPWLGRQPFNQAIHQIQFQEIWRFFKRRIRQIYHNRVFVQFRRRAPEPRYLICIINEDVCKDGFLSLACAHNRKRNQQPSKTYQGLRYSFLSACLRPYNLDFNNRTWLSGFEVTLGLHIDSGVSYSGQKSTHKVCHLNYFGCWGKRSIVDGVCSVMHLTQMCHYYHGRAAVQIGLVIV